MAAEQWKADKKLIHLFQTIGRLLLDKDLEDSHSGNISTLWKDGQGHEKIVITAAGSQKGDLGPSQICFLSPTETDFGYYKASSETDIHAKILSLPGVRAVIHAHTKELTIMTFDEEKKPNKPCPFIPIDALGFYHLNGSIPVDWVKVPVGSPEMTRVIPKRLAHHKITVLQGHGTFARGSTLKEALFNVCVANNSGYIARLADKLDIDIQKLKKEITSSPSKYFPYPLKKYSQDQGKTSKIQGEEEISEEFNKTASRIFRSNLSPFHTGSLSIRGVDRMLYAPKASMPRKIGGPIEEIPLSLKKDSEEEMTFHQLIYKNTDFQTVIHCYVPEAEALSYFIPPDQKKPIDRVIPIDAEGSFFYLVIPILPPSFKSEALIRLLHDYKIVIIRGGGVWSVGEQSLSEALHHPSSLRDICLYIIGAYERGLDLSKLQPEKAKQW
ncbi:MAG: class II aldolase/adducin family protein [Acidobacteriota bacterium]